MLQTVLRRGSAPDCMIRFRRAKIWAKLTAGNQHIAFFSCKPYLSCSRLPILFPHLVNNLYRLVSGNVWCFALQKTFLNIVNIPHIHHHFLKLIRLTSHVFAAYQSNVTAVGSTLSLVWIDWTVNCTSRCTRQCQVNQAVLTQDPLLTAGPSSIR